MARTVKLSSTSQIFQERSTDVSMYDEHSKYPCRLSKIFSPSLAMCLRFVIRVPVSNLLNRMLKVVNCMRKESRCVHAKRKDRDAAAISLACSVLKLPSEER